MRVIDAGCPRNSPTEVVHAYLTGDGIAPADLVAAAEAVEQFEWDDFGSGFPADDERWLLSETGAAEAVEIRERADAHRGWWLRRRRYLVGFAYVTFARPF